MHVVTSYLFIFIFFPWNSLLSTYIPCTMQFAHTLLEANIMRCKQIINKNIRLWYLRRPWEFCAAKNKLKRSNKYYFKAILRLVSCLYPFFYLFIHPLFIEYYNEFNKKRTKPYLYWYTGFKDSFKSFICGSKHNKNIDFLSFEYLHTQ